jgi:hypothetical protein
MDYKTSIKYKVNIVWFRSTDDRYVAELKRWVRI